jgi:FtsP/CotA-like multicopper oxidase with cupredoxin domain
MVVGVVDAKSSATSDPRPTDYIDCNDPCNGGDVNYELRASVKTMPMQFGNYTYRGRTFAPDDEFESQDRPASYMGPTMRVKPGQSLWIKLINDMDGATDDIGPQAVSEDNYWKMLQQPGEKIKYQYYKKPVDQPSNMIVDRPNIPGHWDVTNLHLHGLDVEVHMFDPVGTHNPEAPHVAVHPGQCYCYRFQIPDHHPDGLYWYHPHLHGSSAVQLWGGMMGLLIVEGNLERELADYGITNSHEFVLWDPAFQDIRDKNPHALHDIQVDEFLLGQTTLSKIHPFLVNGQITPNFQVGVGEVLHFRALCGTIENENTFIVYKQGEHNEHWEEAAIPFWIVASDGVTYSNPLKRKVIVMAGGQREELLLQFDEPGEYVISQQGIQGMQFFDMYGHPHDQLLATITVGETPKTQLPTMPIDQMTFTPGYKEEETIQAHDIAKTETIVFSMGANRDQAPFPQYYINGKAFAPDRLDFHAEPGQAVEYILINANHNVHPVSTVLSRIYAWLMLGRRFTDRFDSFESLSLSLSLVPFTVSHSCQSISSEGDGIRIVDRKVPCPQGSYEFSSRCLERYRCDSAQRTDTHLGPIQRVHWQNGLSLSLFGP